MEQISELTEYSQNSLKLFPSIDSMFLYFRNLISLNVHHDSYYLINQNKESGSKQSDAIIGIDDYPGSLTQEVRQLVLNCDQLNDKLKQILEQGPNLQALTLLGYIHETTKRHLTVLRYSYFESIRSMTSLTRLELFDLDLSEFNVESIKQVLFHLEHFTIARCRFQFHDYVDAWLSELNPRAIRNLQLNHICYTSDKLQTVMRSVPRLAHALTHLTVNLIREYPSNGQFEVMDEADLGVVCRTFPNLVHLNVCLKTRVNYYQIVKAVSFNLRSLTELGIYYEKDSQGHQNPRKFPRTRRTCPYIRHLFLNNFNISKRILLHQLPRLFPNLERLSILKNETDNDFKWKYMKNFGEKLKEVNVEQIRNVYRFIEKPYWIHDAEYRSVKYVHFSNYSTFGAGKKWNKI